MEELSDYRCRIGMHSSILNSTLLRGKRIGHPRKAKNGVRKKHLHLKKPTRVRRETDMKLKMVLLGVCKNTNKLRIFNQRYLSCLLYLLICLTALHTNHFALQYGGITVDTKSTQRMDWGCGASYSEWDDLKTSMYTPQSSGKAPEKATNFVCDEALQTKVLTRDMKFVEKVDQFKYNNTFIDVLIVDGCIRALPETENLYCPELCGRYFAKNHATLSTRVSLDYYYGEPCSYLIGNNGCYTYYGNPGNSNEDEQKKTHYAMVLKLSKLVTSKILHKLKESLRYYIDRSDMETISNIFEICDQLLTRGHILYGKYDILITALTEIDAIECRDLVQNYPKAKEPSLGETVIDGSRRPYSASVDVLPSLGQEAVKNPPGVAHSACASEDSVSRGHIIQKEIIAGEESRQRNEGKGITAQDVNEIVDKKLEPIHKNVADIKKVLSQRANEPTHKNVTNIIANNVQVNDMFCSSTITNQSTNVGDSRQTGNELPDRMAVASPSGQNFGTTEMESAGTAKNDISGQPSEKCPKKEAESENAAMQLPNDDNLIPETGSNQKQQSEHDKGPSSQNLQREEIKSGSAFKKRPYLGNVIPETSSYQEQQFEHSIGQPSEKCPRKEAESENAAMQLPNDDNVILETGSNQEQQSEHDIGSSSQNLQRKEIKSGSAFRNRPYPGNAIPERGSYQEQQCEHHIGQSSEKYPRKETDSGSAAKELPNDDNLIEHDIDLYFVHGRLELEEADVIACEVDRNLNLTIDSVAKALLCAEGEHLMHKCRLKYPFGIKPREILSIQAHNLKCKSIYLMSLPDYKQKDERKVVQFAIDKLLRKALHDGIKSIALPAIGRSKLNMSVKEVERFMGKCVKACLQYQPTKNLRIIFVLPDKHETRAKLELNMTKYEKHIFEKEMMRGSSKDHHIKIHTLGHQEAGKSSLMQQLIFLDPEEVKPTDGIKISYGACSINIDTGEWHKNEMKEFENIIRKIKGMQRDQDDDQEANGDFHVNQYDTAQDDDRNQEAPREEERKKEQTMHVPTTQVPDVIKNKLPTGTNIQRENVILRVPSNIETSDIEKEVKKCPEQGQLNEATVHGFDFAGQSIYYTVHQLFLSRIGINLIVMNASLDFDTVVNDGDTEHMCGKMEMTSIDFFKFWAKSLQFYLPKKNKKQVIVVFTHIDRVKDKTEIEKKKKRIKTIIEKMNMDDMFEKKEICCINCKKPDPTHLKQLRDTIFDLAKGVQEKKTVPCTWLLLEAKLKKNKDKCRIMTLEDVKNLNKKSEQLALNQNGLDLFLKFHHDIGTFMHYAKEGVKDIIILDPQWLVDSLKLIITAEHFRDKTTKDREEYDQFKDYGILNRKFMHEVWKECEQEKDNRFYEFRELLTDLMERFDLISCPKLYDENGQSAKSESYVVPCMLNRSEKELISQYQKLDSSNNFIVFHFCNDFLPSAIVHRLLASCIKRYKYKVLYSDAAVFEVYTLHYLLLKIEHHRVIVHVGQHPQRDIGLCQGVREFLNRTLQTITKNTDRADVLYELKVPCNKQKQNGEYGLVKWEENVDSLLCKDHGKGPGHPVQRTVALQYWLVDTTDERYTQDLKTGLSQEVYGASDKVKDLIINLLGTRYMELGHELGVDTNECVKSGTNDEYKIAMNILNTWIEKKLTWKVLTDAMKKIGVGVSLLEEHCCRKHTP